MKVWITKYALTIGIIEARHIDITEPYENMIQAYFIDVNGKLCNDYYVSNEEIFLDKESAIMKAEEMRQKKIESLQKKIRKLEKIRFE